MKIIDITGLIYNGMWNYEEPYPEFELKKIPKPDWLSYKIYAEYFNGMCSQTGTYLETPAHLLGYRKSYPLIDVDLNKLINIKTYVFKLRLENLPEFNGRRAITKKALLEHFDEDKLKGCDAILISTGWGKYWKEYNYLNSSPFFKYEAIEFLVNEKPFLIGSDSPRWENLEKPEEFFPMFFNADILMLAPCINLEKINKEVVRLTALPLKIEKTCSAPCRAMVMYE